MSEEADVRYFVFVVVPRSKGCCVGCVLLFLVCVWLWYMTDFLELKRFCGLPK